MEAICNADNVIVITPNYIHSIPAGTLDFLYALPPSKGNQAIGFIIQSGYPESSESEIICRYLERFAKPVYLTKFQTRMLNASVPISNYLGWNKILKANNCYEKRFDMPYLEKN